MEVESTYAMDGVKIGLTGFFIILNAFFVAAEFALVKVSQIKLEGYLRDKRPFASTALWLYQRQNLVLSVCQLGITMASLALGWIGEPAIAHLITPLIAKIGITSSAVVHGVAFTIAFTIITTLHIVIGEQVPKIYAIKKPGKVFLGSSLILRGFYLVFYPFMYLLNAVTNFFLKWLGIRNANEHESTLSEEEIKGVLSISYAKGELTSNEHNLIKAVFRFDDEVVSKIMAPRSEVEFLDINDTFSENILKSKKSKHSRLPLCDSSLDKVIGVLHMKSLFALGIDEETDLADVARTPMMIPESMLIGKLLQEFRSVKQHFAFVQDEHGTILGIVTLEDVLEELVGELEDEYDQEQPDIVKQADGKYLVKGDVLVDDINEKFALDLEAETADTLSGLIVEQYGHRLKVGQKMNLSEVVEAEIVGIDGIRATKVRLTISPNPE